MRRSAFLVVLVLTLVVAGSASAATWRRTWLDAPAAVQVPIKAELLNIKDGQFTANTEFPKLNVVLNFHPDGGEASLLPPLLVGEQEAVHCVVILATAQDEGGQVFADLTLAVLLAPKQQKPFEWEPQSFKKWNVVFVHEEDPKPKLAALHLVPADQTLDFWCYKYSWHPDFNGPIPMDTLRRALQKNVAGTSPFPVQLVSSRTRAAGYVIPSSLVEAPKVSVDGDGEVAVSWTDAGTTQDRSREQFSYSVTLDKQVGVSGIYKTWKSVTSATLAAEPGEARQRLTFPASLGLKRNAIHRVQVRVVRRSYGQTPAAAAECEFRFAPGWESAPPPRPDDPDPFAGLRNSSGS